MSALVLNAPETFGAANDNDASGAEQRSADWHKDRAGRITASMFGAAIALTEGGTYASGPNKGLPKPVKPKAERQKYMRQLAFERLTGTPKHSIDGKALEWGRDVEDTARNEYERHTGLIVIESPFIVHPKFSFIGASPDGLIGKRGGMEMKCPHEESVHVQTWLEGMPEEHMPQVQGGMMCTDREWWDFVSYDPRQKPELRLYVERVRRDDEYIADLKKGLLQFEVELQEMCKRLEELGAGALTTFASLIDE